ncbi:MAG TPA: thioredoxin family protein [Lacipirellula sp.]
MRRFLMVVAAGLLAATFGDFAHAQADSSDAKEKPKTAALGEPGPAWSKLEGVDGKKHSLADLKDAKAVLVVFTTNHCPVAVAYEDRLNELHHDYKEKGVELVAINVNNIEADRMPAMKKRAEEKEFEFQYLYDPSQEIGRKYGATVTPHVFVLDGKRNVAYMGAIDDNQNPEKAKTHFLRDALDAVLAGKKPDPAKTRQFGCGIQYE